MEGKKDVITTHINHSVIKSHNPYYSKAIQMTDIDTMLLPNFTNSHSQNWMTLQLISTNYFHYFQKSSELILD